MKHILHDASVALWAFRTNHCAHKDFKIAVSWPISIRRAKPTYSNTWTIRFCRPRLHLLNTYRVELDYQFAKGPRPTN